MHKEVHYNFINNDNNNYNYINNYIFSSNKHVQYYVLYVNNFIYMYDKNINILMIIYFKYILNTYNFNMLDMLYRMINIFYVDEYGYGVYHYCCFYHLLVFCLG